MSTNKPSTTRIALRALIVSVVLSAAFGIVVILSGRWGWYEERILETTVTISSASICALACAAVWERKRAVELPLAGIVLTLTAATMVIAGVWLTVNGQTYWKWTASIGVFAVLTSHLCLLSLARLSGGFFWVTPLSVLADYGLAGILSYMIFTDSAGSFTVRALGVDSIIVGSLSVLVPIFHRLSAPDLAAVARAASRPIVSEGDSPVAAPSGSAQPEVAARRSAVSASIAPGATVFRAAAPDPTVTETNDPGPFVGGSRVSGSSSTDPVTAGPAGHVHVVCPSCGAGQESAPGEITCPSCQCVFLFRIVREGTTGKRRAS